ncbi:amidohydrolase [Pseudogracilibacillus sp. ICA-222130]|uniref:amidohydrolase n=1 Tax=Pseudogracilibacillus sp. ICA-222130 TaxID=3134655 RepID=UPI0030C33FED
MEQSLDTFLQPIFIHLHTHPEISWEEKETTNYLVKTLEEMGVQPVPFEGMTGLYVDIGEGEPRVGFRTDIDALWQEVDGQFKANHSCGHDGHMTVALGIVKLLKEMEKELDGAIRIIFQPAEETGAGAKAVIETGIIEPLQYLFGMHVRPLVELDRGTCSASILHGAARLIKGEINGVEAHGARPEQGTNAIEVAAALVAGMKSIWISPTESASIKMTQLEAGGKSANIIPGSATFSLDVRAQKNSVMDELLQAFERVLKSVEAMYEVKIDIDIQSNIVAAEVDKEAERIVYEAIQANVGKEHAVQQLVTPGGEDFHYYTYAYPNLKATMLGLGCGVTPGLHHPHMTFDTAYLKTGAIIMKDALVRALGEVNKDE